MKRSWKAYVTVLCYNLGRNIKKLQIFMKSIELKTEQPGSFSIDHSSSVYLSEKPGQWPHFIILCDTMKHYVSRFNWRLHKSVYSSRNKWFDIWRARQLSLIFLATNVLTLTLSVVVYSALFKFSRPKALNQLELFLSILTVPRDKKVDSFLILVATVWFLQLQATTVEQGPPYLLTRDSIFTSIFTELYTIFKFPVSGP